MNLFGFEIKRSSSEKAMQTVGGYGAGFRVISEPFSGAWQRNVEERRGDVVTYPTLYACIARISSDIGKLPFQLRTRSKSGIWQNAENPAYSPVLRKPNHYQTAAQFREHWILSKLITGNTYVLKKTDARGVVTGLYVLDPERVLPMIADNGAVYYQLQYDRLAKTEGAENSNTIIVPASEIIHDRCMIVHHPLIGVPPVAAANWAAVKNLKILRNATEFFANNAQPGGILTAPAGMRQRDAEDIKAYWNQEYAGSGSDKVMVIGADMKFTPFAVKSVDSQMVEQMRYSDEQICQPFGIPPFKVGIGSIPSGMKVDDINQLYLSDALQSHIEHMESLLDDGLRVAQPLGIELDTEPLLRMDETKRADVAAKLVAGGVETPNEGRSRFNRPELEGGDTVYMQMQDYPMDQVRLNRIERGNPVPDGLVEDIKRIADDIKIMKFKAHIKARLSEVRENA